MPSKILRVNNEAKLEAAPWQARITLQMQLRKLKLVFDDIASSFWTYTANARYFPSGNFTKPRDAG